MHSSVLIRPSAFTSEPLERSQAKLLLLNDKGSGLNTSERLLSQISLRKWVAGVRRLGS